MPELYTKKVDVAIIGSGLAGLLLAHELVAAGRRVLVATKAGLLDSNTRYAQGGLAAVLKDSVTDSRQAHLEDTIKSGAGLVDEAVAEQIINGGAELVSKLTQLGVNFDKTEENHVYSLHLEGGHTSPRVLHSKDTTGKTIAEGLANSLKAKAANEEDLERPIIFENAFALDLLNYQATPLAPRVVTGVLLLTEDGLVSVAASHVVLATGGAGQIFARTTNPSVATGDGIALAARAGAKLADLEFVQFHPTAFFKEGHAAFLISEAVRGQGAILIDDRNRRFAFDFHKDGELATRDTVAKAIHQTMNERNLESVFLDLRPIGADNIESKFPNIVQTLRQLGVDPLKEAIPVCPAAHYYMGGIVADAKGQTSLVGLYAVGECAATGLHGANRLASNSLLEAGVMALNLAKHISAQPFKAIPYRKNSKLTEAWLAHCKPFAVPSDRDALKKMMYRGAGLVRDAKGLEKLSEQLDSISIYKTGIDRYERESANMLLVAKLISKACLLRKESRGGHVRADFASINNSDYLHHITFQRGAWRTQSAHPATFTSSERAVSLARP